jgi:MFS family permease
MAKALMWGYLADIFGRRNTLYIACIFSIASVFMMFFVSGHNYVQLLFARAINGGASAIFSCVVCRLCLRAFAVACARAHYLRLNIWIVVGQL